MGSPATCPYCGEKSKYLLRSYIKGFDKPACPKCRRKDHINCPVCGRHRSPAGTNSKGQVVCRYCLAHEGETFVCGECGKEGKLHSNTRCLECYSRGYIAKGVAAFLPTLSHPFAQELYTGFIEVLCQGRSCAVTRTKFWRYPGFFTEIDQAFENSAGINLATLSERFGTRWLSLWIHPINYLQKIGVLEPLKDVDVRMLMVDEIIARRLERHADLWTGRLLVAFRDELRAIRKRYQARGWKGKANRFLPRTILGNFRAAVAFLESMGEEVKEVTQMEQIHLDTFLMQKPGYRAGMSLFLNFLSRKRKLFRPLKLDRSGDEIPEGFVVGKKRYEELVDGWLDPLNSNPKEALVCILLAVYAQSPLRAISLDMASVQEVKSGAGGVYRLKLAKVWLDLPPEVSDLIGRYLAQRRALALGEDLAGNPHLFPGRKFGQHLNHLVVQEYLDKYQLRAAQLFASSVCAAYARGVRQPKVLARGFGISVPTAIKYHGLFQERIVMETGWRVNG